MLVHHFIGGDVSCELACTTSQVSSSHLSLIFLFPFQASTFTSTRLPGFKFTVHLFFCRSTIFVGMPLQLIGLVPPAGCSSISLSQKLHTCPHSWQRPLSCGDLIAANSWEDEVDWEPRPSSKHQIMWTVPGNCGLCGIVGMCYFSQMR